MQDPEELPPATSLIKESKSAEKFKATEQRLQRWSDMRET